VIFFGNEIFVNFLEMNLKEPSIKDVRSQGEGRLVQCVYFADKRDSSDADVRTFDAKNIGFLEIYGVSARTRGVETVRTFFGNGKGSIFCGRSSWPLR